MVVEIFTAQIYARHGGGIRNVQRVKEVFGEPTDGILLEGRITTLAVGCSEGRVVGYLLLQEIMLACDGGPGASRLNIVDALRKE